MTDRREVPVETTEGFRPGSSGGERILVALAAVVLVVAVVIVGANLLPKDDAVGIASPSPRASVRPSATPFSTPLPRELTLVQESPAPTEPSRPYYGGWIRALVDLEIRAGASEASPVIGTLPAGEAALAGEEDTASPELGWLHIDGPGDSGWVATRRSGEDLVRRYASPDYSISGSVMTLAGGGGGFVALGTASGTTSRYPQPTVYVSTDGASWHQASEPPGSQFYPTAVAFGPAGWLLVGYGGGSQGAEVWISPNREHWRSLGVFQDNYPEALVASPAGYLLRVGGRGGFGSGGELWFSADGIHWSESRPSVTGSYQVTATSAGFYAAAPPSCCPGEPPRSGAFSTDGLAWTQDRPNLLVASVGEQLLGIEIPPGGSAPHAQLGSIEGGVVGWRTMPGGDRPFRNAVITSLVSDGQRATAFGWNLTTEAPLSWTSDGGRWTPNGMPTTFGGLPRIAAAGEGVVVVVGAQQNSRGPNPVVWHQRAGGRWEPERSPVLGIAPEPSTGDCAPPPTDPVEFVSLDHGVAVACYGDAPLTVRLWSSRCDGCSGVAQGTYEEAWLASPSSNALFLSPVKWQDSSWATAVLAPALGTPDPTWRDAWLELTGHFDDPAAARCQWTPPPDQRQYYGGARSVIDGCRQQFVVTEVRVVDGP